MAKHFKFLSSLIGVLIAGSAFSASFFDCGAGTYGEFDCFIEKVENKEKVQIKITNALDTFGIINKATSLHLFEKKPNDQYLYVTEVLKYDVFLSEEMIQEAKTMGIAQEVIDKQNAELKEQPSSEGIVNSCTFSESNFEKFVSILERNKEGSFSALDFQFADCDITTADGKDPNTEEITYLAPGTTLSEEGKTWIGDNEGKPILQTKEKINVTNHSAPKKTVLPKTGGSVMSLLWTKIVYFFGF